VLVLALDTATPAVTAGVVELTATAVVQRSVRIAHDARKHAELLMPLVVGACADAGVALRALAAVVVGIGPGPFTGLRVGMVTAAALGDALEVPVFGVCTLDAIATDAVCADVLCADTLCARPGAALLVATDARRREIYWAAYDSQGHRTDGPHVEAPAALVERLGDLGAAAAAGGSAALTGLPVREPASPSPAGLVTVAAHALRSGTVPGPLEPLYLRRPDAVEPGPRKPVSTG
jgi:tRNA threonylcarbamoyl adenosine modification protein YeaZ